MITMFDIENGVRDFIAKHGKNPTTLLVDDNDYGDFCKTLQPREKIKYEGSGSKDMRITQIHITKDIVLNIVSVGNQKHFELV